MHDERERCLALLGLKPGASAQEIKAAYRDMAKVWHPDRFSHDPRLQSKAQDKLKEINEAYEALTSGNFTRRAQTAQTTDETPAAQEPLRPQRNGSKHQWPLALLLLACIAAAVFFINSSPVRKDNDEAAQERAAAPQVKTETDKENGAPSEPLANRQDKKSVETQKATAAVANAQQSESQAPLKPLPTVTVSIDTGTGLLATNACPSRSSMTYPAGREPQRYCSADHRSTAKGDAQPEAKNKSRLKSALNRAAAPARWLHDKTKDSEPEK